jgi:phosphate transport system permease protein
MVSLLPLVDIIWTVTAKGLAALSWKLFTTVTVGVAGGLANAITGTILLVALALVFAAPLGIAGGLYLSEFGSKRLGWFLRQAADILTGVPSIVLGYFGYVTMVIWLGWGFSLLAGSITLTIIMVPYIMRSAEIAMSRVPHTWREASLALGATHPTTAFRIVLRGGIPGILTGVIIAVGRAMGETAPLIYTAAWSNYMPTGSLIHSPVGYLTYAVWNFINEPFASAHALAYAAALILILMVLAFNIVGRLLVGRRAL